MHKPRTIREETVFSGELLELRVDEVELPDGRHAIREFVLHPGAACILALREPHSLILVRQYRHAVDSELWEIPAGKLDPGETPLQCAKRELLEETGYEAATWHECFRFLSSPGFSNEWLTLFIARSLSHAAARWIDEIPTCRTFPIEQAWRMVHSGEITDAKTILAIQVAVAEEQEASLGT
ncbi:NUDIX hydrolase [Candidatus Bipolaricaulota bacterium]|nr:NUDIX hydrolase [Candidatus Bipolaricaulota bacterium]